MLKTQFLVICPEHTMCNYQHSSFYEENNESNQFGSMNERKIRTNLA